LVSASSAPVSVKSALLTRQDPSADFVSLNEGIIGLLPSRKPRKREIFKGTYHDLIARENKIKKSTGKGREDWTNGRPRFGRKVVISCVDMLHPGPWFEPQSPPERRESERSPPPEAKRSPKPRPSTALSPNDRRNIEAPFCLSS